MLLQIIRPHEDSGLPYFEMSHQQKATSGKAYLFWKSKASMIFRRRENSIKKGMFGHARAWHMHGLEPRPRWQVGWVNSWVNRLSWVYWSIFLSKKIIVFGLFFLLRKPEMMSFQIKKNKLFLLNFTQFSIASLIDLIDYLGLSRLISS